MALPELKITKNWFTSTTVIEKNWDNIRTPLIAWANQLRLDLEQMVTDTFGASYSIDNDGLPNLSQSLQDQISSIVSGGFDLVGTNNDTWTVNLDGAGKAVISSSGLTSARTMTFPDSNQTMVGTTATQTLTNKTLTSPTINTATLTVDTVDPPNSNARVTYQSLLKGFIFSNSVPGILSSYNIASVSKISTGHYEVVMDRNFTSANTGIPSVCGFAGVGGSRYEVSIATIDGETFTVYTHKDEVLTDSSFFINFSGTLV